MDNWDELRTAYEVARRGTVSGAATALGVHHATVIRHVDALEARLGVKLFQRHPRGYTPTEAGEELARVARATDDQFSQLAAKLSGQGAEVSGDLVVTALASFTPRIMPLLAGFHQDHPAVRLRYRTGHRLFRLEYGEAHVAVRAGKPPEEPDNVAQPLMQVAFALYAAPDYIARHGTPGDDLAGHHFVGPDDDDPGSPLLRWTVENVAPEAIAFRASDDVSLAAAVRAGLGLGFLAEDEAEGMVQILPPRPEWEVTLWLVTHVDLHRSAKVQALTRHLKAAFQ
ncbi:LysR family transcriptional regulator [Sinisalibacter lacisalsi]|uniref:LysR family transcriptional regulator n=1 Tax=Sinisalibacter lacisalsi TaxID=1526570 RepID=A0ABQ1QVV5_9RHOB|nr:LysR family transcriptional regulator [Sinisalibacter lacisalsi]GGD46493.1 LysR family transcriptional regulator [Sinisalibacter lacisalsi]